MEKTICSTYQLFRYEYYENLYKMIKANDEISPHDLIYVEVIYLLNNPTISEFAKFTNMSLPNASYRIKKMIKAGYIDGRKSTDDSRETTLFVTDSFLEFYSNSGNYIDFVLDKIKTKTTKREKETVEKALKIICKAISE